MEEQVSMKALNIIVNAGFADEIMDIVREQGANGATILNARGAGATHHMFMGISLDIEKEIIISIVRADIADRIMTAIKERAGINTPAHAICYTMPVDKFTKLDKTELKPEDME